MHLRIEGSKGRTLPRWRGSLPDEEAPCRRRRRDRALASWYPLLAEAIVLPVPVSDVSRTSVSVTCMVATPRPLRRGDRRFRVPLVSLLTGLLGPGRMEVHV
jgi:hypothetical protein